MRSFKRARRSWGSRRRNRKQRKVDDAQKRVIGEAEELKVKCKTLEVESKKKPKRRKMRPVTNVGEIVVPAKINAEDLVYKQIVKEMGAVTNNCYSISKFSSTVPIGNGNNDK